MPRRHSHVERISKKSHGRRVEGLAGVRRHTLGSRRGEDSKSQDIEDVERGHSEGHDSRRNQLSCSRRRGLREQTQRASWKSPRRQPREQTWGNKGSRIIDRRGSRGGDNLNPDKTEAIVEDGFEPDLLKAGADASNRSLVILYHSKSHPVWRR